MVSLHSMAHQKKVGIGRLLRFLMESILPAGITIKGECPVCDSVSTLTAGSRKRRLEEERSDIEKADEQEPLERDRRDDGGWHLSFAV